jgi:hypothetical protein
MASPKRASKPPAKGPPKGGGTRITFYGFAAYVGALRGPAKCGWWPDDPNSLHWKEERLIETDLSKTPSAARNGEISIADIQCDDHRTDGGMTEIGPRFPQGKTVGAIWVRDTYWNSLGRRQPNHPASKDSHPYELTSIVYLDGPLKGRRFHGLHAKVTGTCETHLAKVQLWQPGRARIRDERPFGEFWIDLARDAHPFEIGATEIDGREHLEGPLFVDHVFAQSVLVHYPKLPYWLGGEYL